MEHLLLRATARAEERHFWFRGFRAFMTPFIERAVGGDREARILDCGCGTGANVEMLSRFGHALGFDLSPVGWSIGRELGRCRLLESVWVRRFDSPCGSSLVCLAQKPAAEMALTRAATPDLR